MKNILSRLGFLTFFMLWMTTSFVVFSDDGGDTQPKKETILHEKPSQAPEKLEVKPKTRDDEISKRLEDILNSTGWFIKPHVEVQNGVVFLSGETKNHKFKDWAGDLAHNTQDVAAVVNKIVVLEPSVWDLHMILQELINQGRKVLRALPSIIFGSIILFIAWLLARLVYKLVPLIYRDKVNPSLLHEVIARAVSFFVFLIGVYFIFEMADLTTMALTIISGTGLLGIILGIAFRDIAENFLASILLSLQNPFRVRDKIDIVCPVTGYTVTGYVERLTMRVTILVSPDGNHLQIPNATVYKSNILNYSSNPNHRETFLISIGTNCSVSQAVESALKVLLDQEAILQNPEPLVLVDSLEKDSVNLRIYYWIDNRKYNALKIKSSVIRLVKQALQTEGIELPSRGITKEAEIPVVEQQTDYSESAQTTSEAKSKEDSHKEDIQGLSPQSRQPEKGKNLLNSGDQKSESDKEKK